MKDEILDLINKEEERQGKEATLIASENFTYPEVLEVLGSCLTNKYAEGYPGKRYYQGNRIVDEIEQIAIERTKKLFGVEAANVQAYSGSPANAAILMALAQPGEKIAGLKLSAGGHLTHGHPKVTFSGQYFESLQFDVDEEGRIDYEEVSKLVESERPKVLMVGSTAYPWIIDWEKFGKMAESVGAWLVADISHLSGLIAGGVHPSPVPHAHIIMSTTHKMLRGPRGAVIGVTSLGLAKDNDLGTKIDKVVFPGLQGGPHMNNIAGIAIALQKAGEPEYKEYAQKVVVNAKFLADELKKAELKVWGTENHLMVVGVGEGRGKEVAQELEKEGIIVNANTIPHDPAGPFKPSGIRLGTPAMTVKGWGEKEWKEMAIEITRKVIGS